MAGRISTHVLDTIRGTGAGGMKIGLSRMAPAPHEFPAVALDEAGRAVLLEGETMIPGIYQIIFCAGAYQQARAFAAQKGAERFLDEIPVRFRINDGGISYHIPLILSAFGYTTYRGG